MPIPILVCDDLPEARTNLTGMLRHYEAAHQLALEIETGEVSEKLGRGRHTTRHVELFPIGGGTCVADTPGFASFDLELMEPIPKEELADCFPEFRSCAGDCRFLDCTHRKEPDCAVLAAVAAGQAGQARPAETRKLPAPL